MNTRRQRTAECSRSCRATNNHALGEKIGIRLDVDHVVAFPPEGAVAA